MKQEDAKTEKQFAASELAKIAYSDSAARKDRLSAAETLIKHLDRLIKKLDEDKEDG